MLSDFPHAIVSRRGTLVLVAGALLPRPTTVHAQVDDQGIAWVSGLGGTRGFLHIAPDGRLRIRGTVRVRNDAGTTVVLQAEPDSAEATFADANGNGTTGLTLLTFVARNVRTEDRVPVSLATRDAEDIDRNGRYVIALRIGEQEDSVAVAFRVRPPRRRRRRRR